MIELELPRDIMKRRLSGHKSEKTQDVYCGDQNNI